MMKQAMYEAVEMDADRNESARLNLEAAAQAGFFKKISLGTRSRNMDAQHHTPPKDITREELHHRQIDMRGRMITSRSK